MKNITKKQWGIAGTSIGSILIIVALLTMVGVGSNDSYAASVTQCICESGTYDPTTNKCTREEKYLCCMGEVGCKGTDLPQCTNLVGCESDSSSTYQCTRYIANECACPAGMTSDGAGGCVQKYCPGGQYSNHGECVACPANATCPAGSSTFTCNTGYKKNTAGTACIPDSSDTCPAGEYRAAGDCVTCPQDSYCPGGTDSTRHDCPVDRPKSNAGSTSINDCKTASSNTCPAGEYRAAGDCVTCPQDSYCPGGTDSTRHDCPVDRPKSNAGSTSINDCKTSGLGGADNPSSGGGNPNTPGGGDPSSGGNPSTPSGGDASSGGNDNTNQNPNTATKTPLVIAIIGTMSMALGIFAYFKGKKEINTEI